MKKETSSRKWTSQVGPNIVRAWFDTVLNPLLSALEGERHLLQQKKWTWRFQPPGLEWIRPVDAWITARPNLEQFLKLSPTTKAYIRLHDGSVSRLLEKCKELHDVIEKSPDLRRVYQQATSPQSLSKLGVTNRDLFGAYPESDQLALLAQYIVNNVGDLGFYDSLAPLWNAYRKEFLGILSRPGVQPRSEATFKAGETLLRNTGILIRWLEETRLRLSLKHDVPIVVPSSSEK
jgi:hypothetical protein